MIISQNITKTYRPHPLILKKLFNRVNLNSQPVFNLKDLTFTINTGECVGIIGQNGSGKSTLLKLLAGVTVADSGKLEIGGKVTPLIELGAGFNPELSGRENIFLNATILGWDQVTISANFEEIVNFAELAPFIDQPVKKYSSGMYLRLAFAIATQIQPEILLIDEILAVGDLDFQQKCLRRLSQFKNNGTTIILVSHSISLIRSFCQRTIYLNQGKIKKDALSEEACDLYQQDLEKSNQIKQNHFISSEKSIQTEPKWQTRLFSPTYATKIGSLYFIVDCWHHRILYNHNLIDKICYWSTLSSKIREPHSLASDGEIIVTESAVDNILYVFSLAQIGGGGEFAPQQILPLPSPHLRPHRLQYCPINQLFFCLCAQSQTMIILQKTHSSSSKKSHSPNNIAHLEIIKSINLDFLQKKYTRSFTISPTGQDFYFTASSDQYSTNRHLPPTFQPANANIIHAKFNIETKELTHRQSFPVPLELANMNDIFIHQDYFYLSATPQQLFRFKNLSDLSKKTDLKQNSNNIYEKLNLNGTPYYLSIIDHRLYIPEITQSSRLTSVKILNDNSLVDIKSQYDFGSATRTSLERKNCHDLS